MKKVNTFGIQFVIRKHRIKEGTAPIYARVTVNTSRCEISVKRRILVSSWNNGKGIATGKSPEITALNAYLEQIRSQLAGHYQDLVSSRKKVTAEAIKNRFIGFDESEKTLMELIDFHNIRMDSNLKWGTQKNYFTTKKYVELFLNKKFKKSDIYLSDLNYKFISDFEIERLQQVKDIFVFSCYTGLAYLKEIADLCRINKNLTFHIARHTFATTVTLSNGVPIESVSKMLGHSDLRTTQIYAKVVEKKIIE